MTERALLLKLLLNKMVRRRFETDQERFQRDKLKPNQSDRYLEGIERDTQIRISRPVPSDIGRFIPAGRSTLTFTGMFQRLAPGAHLVEISDKVMRSHR
jgi:hypothetical protein